MVSYDKENMGKTWSYLDTRSYQEIPDMVIPGDRRSYQVIEGMFIPVHPAILDAGASTLALEAEHPD